MGFAEAFIQTSIKFVVFVIIAVAGVLCGKKYRQYKDANSVEKSEV